MESASPSCSTPVQASEKHCKKANCNINKLIAAVPKRKITEFVSEPTVMPKPMLVNGLTAVFQVDGESARLKDIKNPADEGSTTKPIYRIIPNTHVHVVNYVFLDDDQKFFKKFTEKDPVTMQKLFGAQKDSADQMLKQIINGKVWPAVTATVVSAKTLQPQPQTIPVQQSQTKHQMMDATPGSSKQAKRGHK